MIANKHASARFRNMRNNKPADWQVSMMIIKKTFTKAIRAVASMCENPSFRILWCK
jgi:hypothetical protein